MSCIRIFITILFVIIFFTFNFTTVYSSPIDIQILNCPTKLNNGERGTVSFQIVNLGSLKLNLNDIHMIIDRGLKVNQTDTNFINERTNIYQTIDAKEKIIITGDFISKESGIHYIEMILNYTLDSERFYENSKSCKINVNLQSSNSSQSGNYINSIIAVGGAIIGGISGAFFTYINGKKIEEVKSNIERKKENDVNKRLEKLIISELESTKDELTILKSNSEEISLTIPLGESQEIDGLDNSDIWIIKDPKKYNYKILDILPKKYLDLSIDQKSKLFTEKSLIEIEKVYSLIKDFKLQKRIFNIEGREYGDRIYFSKKSFDTLFELLEDTLNLIKSI